MSTARVRCALTTVRSASLGDSSPLPRFTPLRALPPTEVGPGIDADMRERIAYGRLVSPLPYRVQSGYDRRPVPTEVPTVELDNGVLRVVVLPGLGGRVLSILDRRRHRELLFVNPVLQYANFGLTDAWFAGGIEWNLGSTGHTTMSSRPMHVAVLHRSEGDVVRLWEWERTRDLVLQVDLTLPEGSDRLYASTRVLNPDPEDKPLYYWTNIAVPETATSRVLAGADSAWRTDYAGRLSRVGIPHPDDESIDVSRPQASRRAADYFFDVAAQASRHVVAVEGDGRGFAESSTEPLRGRKLFVWGRGPGGDRWQEWLCGQDARYLEIQAGRCSTQLEHDVLPGHGEISWTECFGAIDLDPGVVEAPYADAADQARRAVLEAAPPAELERRHEDWRAEVADAAVDDVIAVGSGWGHTELLMRGDASPVVPAASLPFPEVDDDSVPARALVRGDRALFEQTLHRLPVPPVSDRWRALVRSSGEHWWLAYADAVQCQLRGDRQAARAAYLRSDSLSSSAGALRGLALLAAEDGDVDEAARYYERARAIEPGCRELVTEELRMLLDAGLAERCSAVIEALPAEVRRHGRTRLQEAQALAASGFPDRADALLADLVVEDLAEGETALGDLWAHLHPGTEVPARLDFRMFGTDGE